MVHYQGKELIKGRPPGSKNKLTREFHEAYEEAKSRGYTHPYLRYPTAHLQAKFLRLKLATARILHLTDY